MAIASVGGLHALVTLARTSKVDGVLEQVDFPCQIDHLSDCIINAFLITI